MGLNDKMKAGLEKGELNVTFLIDTSGSMIGEKISQLNTAMRTAIGTAEKTAAKMETVKLKMRFIEFNSTTSWICGTDKENTLDHLDWVDLTAGGSTDTAGAVSFAHSIMHTEYLGTKAFSPIVILITDGESDDRAKTIAEMKSFKEALRGSANPDEDRMIRVAIAVQDSNMTELKEFASVGNLVGVDEVGNETDRKENVPFIFEVKDLTKFEQVLQTITYGSIVSSTTRKGKKALEIPIPPDADGFIKIV